MVGRPHPHNHAQEDSTGSSTIDLYRVDLSIADDYLCADDRQASDAEGVLYYTARDHQGGTPSTDSSNAGDTKRYQVRSGENRCGLCDGDLVSR